MIQIWLIKLGDSVVICFGIMLITDAHILTQRHKDQPLDKILGRKELIWPILDYSAGLDYRMGLLGLGPRALDKILWISG